VTNIYYVSLHQSTRHCINDKRLLCLCSRALGTV
jgi:hypothetical protein